MTTSPIAVALIIFGFILNVSIYFWFEFKYLNKRRIRIIDLRRTDPDYEIGRDISNDEAARNAQVNNSNIATDFQLSTVYPNIIFGILGNIFVPLANALAFLCGGFLYQRFVQNGYPIFFRNNSLHSYIADVHGHPTSRRYWAFFSVFGFLLIIAFEITFLASLLKLILGYDTLYFYLFILSLVTFSVWFTVTSGQRIVFGSDQIQLLLSYVGVHGILFGLFYTVGKLPTFWNALIGIMLLVMLGSIIARLGDSFAVVDKQRSVRIRIVIFNGAVIAVTAVTFVFGARAFSMSGAVGEFKRFSFSGLIGHQSILSFVFMLLAITLPALCWRFVDFSFWQRNKAIYFCKSGAEIEKSKNKTVGSWSYYFESALTYILPILIGLFVVFKWPTLENAVQDQNRDAVAESISLVLSGNIILFCSGVVFVWGLVAISMSTVTEYFVAIATLFGRDIFAGTPNEMMYGRRALIFFGIFVALAIVLIEAMTSSAVQIVAAMIGSFGVLTAISPLVLYPLLTGRSLNTIGLGKLVFFAAPSIGALLSLGFTVGTSVLSSPSPTDLTYWIATPAAFGTSWLIYYLGIVCCGSRKFDLAELCVPAVAEGS